MMEPLASPTRVVEAGSFTADLLERIVLYLGGNADAGVMVITDPRPFPVRDAALAELARRRKLAGHRKLTVLDQVVPDPKTADIDAMAERARAEKPALILGVGGGSTLDSAKAVAMLTANEGLLDEYLGPNPARKIGTKGPLLVLIPTTAGTGSEVTRFGVYTARTGRKYTLASPLLRSDAAVLCAALVADLPQALVASAGFDALTHALETLWNRNATPLSDALAEEAAVAVLETLLPAWEEAGRRADASKGGAPARAALLAAANKAGIAFDKTGTAAIHALSFILSEEWHLPHGSACAFFTDTVYELNSRHPAVAAKLARVMRRIGQGAGTSSASSDAEAAALLGKAIGTLRAKIGLANVFSDLNQAAPDRDATLQRFVSALTDPKMANNIVPVGQAELTGLIEPKLA
jgi:alcohol dehydrogenase class IV